MNKELKKKCEEYEFNKELIQFIANIENKFIMLDLGIDLLGTININIKALDKFELSEREKFLLALFKIGTLTEEMYQQLGGN